MVTKGGMLEEVIRKITRTTAGHRKLYSIFCSNVYEIRI